MRIKAGTFNLFNMMLPDTFVRGNVHISKEDYEKKIHWVSHQLRQMNSDVVAFQEVFHKKALEEAVGESGIYPNATVIVPHEDGENPRVGLISRLKVNYHESIVDFPKESLISIGGVSIPMTRFERPVLKVSLELPGGIPLIVFVTHLKSKRPVINDPNKKYDFMEVAKGEAVALFQRGLEAVALRCLVLKEIENSKTPAIVMGDLNDSPHSVTTDILMGKVPKKKYPYEIKQKIWDCILYSTNDIQIKKSYKDVYFTHLHNSHYESLDHILISEEFFHENPNRIGFVEYMHLYNDHLIDPALTDEEIPIWQSDHAQVVVSIKLEERHPNWHNGYNHGNNHR